MIQLFLLLVFVCALWQGRPDDCKKSYRHKWVDAEYKKGVVTRYCEHCGG